MSKVSTVVYHENCCQHKKAIGDILVWVSGYLASGIKAIGYILVWVSGSILLLELVLKNYRCCFFSFSQVSCGLIYIKKDLYLGPLFIKFVLKQALQHNMETPWLTLELKETDYTRRHLLSFKTQVICQWQWCLPCNM